LLAAVCRGHGPPETVELGEIDPPALGPGQVRVAVDAAAVNYPDVLLVADRYQVSIPAPFVPGSEFAGRVVEVADGWSRRAEGDRVCGSALFGAFAEEVVVAEGALRDVPRGMDVREAAAFGVAHRTAYHVLRSVARVAAGEELVVLGAGGGVGLAAVQLGTLLGAEVTAVASSSEKLAAAAAAGARRGIDHRAGDLRRSLRDHLPGGSDVVVDPVGGTLSEPALRNLRYGGRFVTVGYASGEVPRIPLNLVLLKGIRLEGFQFVDFATHRPADMARDDEELDALVSERGLRPHVGATFSLADVPTALRYVADGRAVGKVVVDVAGSREG
jgi:NADPH2:quinone reductase